MVVRLQPHLAELKVLGGVEVGMCYVEASVEDIGSSEGYERFPGSIFLPDPLERAGLKPYEVNHAAAISEVCYETPLPSLTLLLVAQDFASQLHEGHVGR